MWRKILALVFVLCVVAMVSQNVLASGPFARYTNDSYRLSMDYPEGWTTRDVAPAAVIMFLSPLENENDTFMENVNIVVEDLKQPMALDEYTNLSVEQIKQFISDVVILSVNYSPSGQLPYSDIIFTGRQGQFKLKWVSRTIMVGNRVYLLTYTAEIHKFDQYFGDVEAMFNSFRVD